MTTDIQINGISYPVNLSSYPADTTLNTFIREHAQLTATKFMCLEGGCGACIVVLHGRHPATGEMRTWAVNSCLTLLNTCIDCEITTLEGIGNKQIGYHPLQKRLAQLNGTQCGYCTSGMIMNMYGLLESKSGNVTMTDVENSFGGNLCRCTGYRPILDTMKSFATDSNIQLPADCATDIEDLHSRMRCNRTGKACKGASASCGKPLTTLSYDGGIFWYWPKTLIELFNTLSRIGNTTADVYMLVAGNTAHGVYRRPRNIKHFIDINAVPDLKQHALQNDKLTLGGNLSLTETMDIFRKAATRAGFEYCQELWKHFDLIANVGVRNTGTLAGNMAIKKANPDFPSDIYLCFEALDAKVIVQDNANTKQQLSVQQYLRSNSNKRVVIAFELPALTPGLTIYKSYKIMPRAQNAHAYVNAAFLLGCERSGIINYARICFGGIRPEFTHATTVENMLIGKDLHAKQTVANVFAELAASLQPNATLNESSPEYRRKLACGLFYKYLLKTAPAQLVKESYKSGGDILERPLSSGVQNFDTNPKFYPLTQPVQKLEALIQCTGEAKYMNDIITSANTVYCAFVTATKIGAAIEQIDPSKALEMHGVIAFYSAHDIPGTNSFTDSSLNYLVEEVFCPDRVKHYDQPVGMIVAINSDIANYAATLVKIFYSYSSRQVHTCLADVLESNKRKTDRKNLESSWENLHISAGADVTASGIFEMESQYQFPLEPQTTVAIPVEQGLEVYCATQWMDHTQNAIAKMLRLNANNVQMKVRRLGGSYGAKVTRGNQVACAASLAAYKLNRPARFVQTIESMMNSNGKRWSCYSEYEFHVQSSGKIIELKNKFYEDAGCVNNETFLLVHTLTSARNCYQLTDTNYKLEGQFVHTDAPTTSWCRAPAAIEGIGMIENIMEHIAFETNVDPVDVRLINVKPGNKIAELLPKFIANTEYRQRRQEINNFNAKNRWRKRGIGIAVMEFEVFQIGPYSATVAIYHSDGSVVITHGGIEMGQGINTKVAQVAAYTLGVPLDTVKVEASNTINGANSFATGSSMGSESVGFAVRKACLTLNDRLQPIKQELGQNATWAQVVQTAWQRSINLIANEVYKVGDIPKHSIFGLALTEVEIDILTGNLLIKRADILEDTGESLSPYVDIGQVEGSFVMALGYWLTEKLVFDRQTGQLLSNRTWNYKPPGAKDIPIDFRIELLQKSPNPSGFLRSKTTGEPPCCLAVGVIFAIQQALQSARNDAGLPREWIRLGTPTSPEDIVLNAHSNEATFSLQ